MSLHSSLMPVRKHSDRAVLAPVRSQTLTDQIVQSLTEAILSGKFKPGEWLKEGRLAEELHLSRIPVREAIRRLEEQGLVVIVPRRGAFVVSLSAEEIQKINSLRLVLEAEALILCRANLTSENEREIADLIYQWEEQIHQITPSVASGLDLGIHRKIWSFAGNEYLLKALTSLTVPLFAHQTINKLTVEKRRWGANSHVPLLEYVQGNSSLSAEEVILNHLKFGWEEPERFSHLGVRKADAPDETAVIEQE